METDRDISPGDEADRADYYRESVIDDHVKEAMRRAADIPVGTAGECLHAENGQVASLIVNALGVEISLQSFIGNRRLK